MKKFWEGWKEIAGYVGEFQARMILTVLYFTVVAPFAFLIRVFMDRLQLKSEPQQSGWTQRSPVDVDLESARRLF